MHLQRRGSGMVRGLISLSHQRQAPEATLRYKSLYKPFIVLPNLVLRYLR